MPAPAFLPIALGVGVLLMASGGSAKDKKKSPAPGAPPPFPGTPPPFPGAPTPAGACALDAHMPAAIQESTKQLLANATIPASTLIAASQIADANGFPAAAQCLRDAAAARGGSQTAPPGFDPSNPATWPGAIPGLPGMPTVPKGPPPATPPGIPPGVPSGPPPPPGVPGGPPPPPGVPGGSPPVPGGAIPFPGVPGGIPLPGMPGGIPLPGMPGGHPLPGMPGGLPFPGMPGLPPGTPPQTGIGPMPHTIRSGDRPFGLATYYTGNGARFREIEPLNPQLGPLRSGVPPYATWVVGNEILLPAEWDPWNKPTPPLGL